MDILTSHSLDIRTKEFTRHKEKYVQTCTMIKLLIYQIGVISNVYASKNSYKINEGKSIELQRVMYIFTHTAVYLNTLSQKWVEQLGRKSVRI